MQNSVILRSGDTQSRQRPHCKADTDTRAQKIPMHTASQNTNAKALLVCIPSVMSSQRMTPKENTSADLPYRLPCSLSGALQAGELRVALGSTISVFSALAKLKSHTYTQTASLAAACHNVLASADESCAQKLLFAHLTVRWQQKAKKGKGRWT